MVVDKHWWICLGRDDVEHHHVKTPVEMVGRKDTAVVTPLCK